jgi:hypothetical protein
MIFSLMPSTEVMLGKFMLVNNEGSDDSGRPAWIAAAATAFGTMDRDLLLRIAE